MNLIGSAVYYIDYTADANFILKLCCTAVIIVPIYVRFSQYCCMYFHVHAHAPVSNNSCHTDIL